MRIAELFAGSGSIRKAADRHNAIATAAGRGPMFEVWSTDWTAFDRIDHVGNILDLELQDLPWAPDFIWASVPCTTYSLLAIGHHRNGPTPKTEAAVIGDQIVQHTLNLIRRSGAGFIMENPRAMLRKMPFMRGIDRRTVTYCSYGDNVMKPTDLWSNTFRSLLLPEGIDLRPMCYNNNKHCHHDRAPRYSTLRSKGMVPTGGTTERKNAYERSIIPAELCFDVLGDLHRMFANRTGPWSI